MESIAKYIMRSGQIVVIEKEPEFPEIDTIERVQRELKDYLVLVAIQDKTLKMSLACKLPK